MIPGIISWTFDLLNQNMLFHFFNIQFSKFKNVLLWFLNDIPIIEPVANLSVTCVEHAYTLFVQRFTQNDLFNEACLSRCHIVSVDQ